MKKGATILHKICETFFRFIIVSVHLEMEMELDNYQQK